MRKRVSRDVRETLVINAAELVGQILQSGLSRSTADRLRHALGPRGLGQPGGPLGEWFGQPAGRDSGRSGGMPGGLAESAQEFIGADRSGRSASPLAVGGVGALAGALLGGSGGAVKGALGGGAMALLGGLALSALGRSQPAPDAGQPAQQPPLGLRPARDAAEAERLDQTATLILAAMINAAKADGQVDQEELQRIVGKLRKAGAEAEAMQFVMSELRKPMDLEGLIRDVPDQQVAVQLYAASLLAIEVDTEAERQYLRRLAHGLGLDAGVVRRVHECLGMDHG
jgi:uncharacterized membrane protein YebE (DUF533 family)